MQPFCLRELELLHGGQRTASGQSDISELEHKLLLPSTRYGEPYGGYHDDANISLSVKNPSGDATIVVHPYCVFTFKGAAFTVDSHTISKYSPLLVASTASGQASCATSCEEGALRLYDGWTHSLPAASQGGKRSGGAGDLPVTGCFCSGCQRYATHLRMCIKLKQVFCCMTHTSLVSLCAEPDAHNRSRAQQRLLAVLMWLMPQLSPQLRTPDGQVAASTPRKPRVLSSPSSPHSPNAPGPSQVSRA